MAFFNKCNISCYASKLNTKTGSPARPTIIVEKLTVKLDAQQLIAQVGRDEFTAIIVLKL